jgi:hypothetical protein
MLTPSDLLKISTCWNSYKTGFLFKMYQIKNFDWLSQENFDECIQRLDSFGFQEGTQFECEYKVEHRLIPKKEIVGFIDCEFENNVYEFKCCSELKKEHRIQLALYKYLYEKNKKHNQTISLPNTKYYLYNILTDELLLLETDINEIEEMVDYLLFHKYEIIPRITDEEFLLEIVETFMRFDTPED